MSKNKEDGGTDLELSLIALFTVQIVSISLVQTTFTMNTAPGDSLSLRERAKETTVVTDNNKNNNNSNLLLRAYSVPNASQHV